MTKYHLAQINIALAKSSMDSELMQGFVDRLDEINSLADKSKGFVWRLQSEDGDATAIRVFNEPLMLINLSVWESIETLKHFVYKSGHVELIRDRDAWFNKMIEMHQALWWIPEGHIPTPDEGKIKLDYLQTHGPGGEAFTFARPYKSRQ